MTDSLPIGKLATRWLQQDRDPDTRREMEALIAADDGNELERRLRKRIAFGTAGLRSSMKAGYAHMNSLTVLQASQGLADYILAQRHLQGTAGRPTVVIGYDARHNSQKFARLSAVAFLAKGFEVLWFGILVHTPMVPFAVSHFGAAGGVMVTASHNPPADNGYKVYWGNGCQIIPPHDKGIALAIADVEVGDMRRALSFRYPDIVKLVYPHIAGRPILEGVEMRRVEAHMLASLLINTS